jgi:hypothetical protein
MDEEVIPIHRVANAVAAIAWYEVVGDVGEFGRPAGEPPYGRELELRDPAGNRLRISTSGN